MSDSVKDDTQKNASPSIQGESLTGSPQQPANPSPTPSEHHQKSPPTTTTTTTTPTTNTTETTNTITANTNTPNGNNTLAHDSYIQRTKAELPPLQETPYAQSLDPFQHIARRDLALHLKLLNIPITPDAHDELFELFEMHIHSLMDNLHKITNIQRRKKASPKDLDLLLRNCQIRTNELEEEYEKSNKLLKQDTILKKVELEKLSESLLKRNGSNGEELDTSDPSYVFFVQDQEIYNLVPSTYTKKNQKAIPVYLPEFPPDHTYRKSPIYLNKIPDQKSMRSKLVEESRFVGQAIDKLVVSNKVEIREQEEFEKENAAKYDTSKNNRRKKLAEGLGYDIWNFTEKRLDIPAYARARLEYLRRKKDREEKPMSEEQEDYDRMVINLSPYAKSKGKGNSDSSILDPSTYLSNLQKEAIYSVKLLKQKKIERDEKKKELEKKAELERKVKLKEEQRLAREARAAAKAAKEASEANGTSNNDSKANPGSVDDFENFGNNDFDNFDTFDTFGEANNGGELIFEFAEEKTDVFFGEELEDNNEPNVTETKKSQDIAETSNSTEDVEMVDASDATNVVAVVVHEDKEDVDDEVDNDDDKDEEMMTEFDDLI